MIDVEAAGAGPGHGLLDGVGHERRVEGQGDLKVFEGRVEHGAAVELLLAQLGLMLVLALGFEGEGRQVLRVAGEHVVVGGVGDGDGDRAASVVDARSISTSTCARVMSLTDSIGVASP